MTGSYMTNHMKTGCLTVPGVFHRLPVALCGCRIHVARAAAGEPCSTLSRRGAFAWCDFPAWCSALLTASTS